MRPPGRSREREQIRTVNHLEREPIFSVITPTFNRVDEIRELLRSLEVQKLDSNDFEVVIVDDGSEDGTRSYLETFARDTSLQLRFLTQDHKGPGAARNLGMSVSRGQIYVFIDSDCLASPEWLYEIRRHFERDPSIDAFGGRDDAHDSFSSLLKAINFSMTSFLFTGGMRGGAKKRLAKFYPRSFNMGLRRGIAEKIGGFGALRHGQDIEFSHRLIRSGARVVYIHEAVVYHKRRTSLKKFFRQVFNWGVARINLSRIDRAMLEPLHFLPALGFWAAVLFTGLALFCPAVRALWLGAAALVLFILLTASVHAGVRSRSLAAGALVPLVTLIQISGYGLGFSMAYVWRVMLGKGEFTGFVKRYYA